MTMTPSLSFIQVPFILLSFLCSCVRFWWPGGVGAPGPLRLLDSTLATSGLVGSTNLMTNRGFSSFSS